MNGGRWTEQEHQSFLAGLRLYGREWKKVASKIKTRTSAQIRSHAQKYFAKLARDDELRRHGGGASGLLPQPGFHADGALAPSMYGYFSDGGSSAALNSGDEDAGDNDANSVGEAARRPPQKRLAPAPSAVTGSPAQYQSVGPATAFQYRQMPSSGSKKRSRLQSPVDGTVADPSLASGSHYQTDAGVKQRRLAAAKPAALELMPSQEELIEKASPNVRRRLSSLIEAELCALQVLSCYAMLQQHSQRPVHSPPFRATPALGLAMISTEQMPSASSIY
jgi:SHAQKYF class myb-like DNA-binding protein